MAAGISVSRTVTCTSRWLTAKWDRTSE
jgi:hypothetical protein